MFYVHCVHNLRSGCTAVAPENKARKDEIPGVISWKDCAVSSSSIILTIVSIDMVSHLGRLILF